MENTGKTEQIVQETVVLTRGSMLRIDDGRDAVVCVLQGELWLTQHHDERDLLLRAGDRFRLDREGAAIAYAFSRSAVAITAPERKSYAQRVVVYRSGSKVPIVLYSAAQARVALLERLFAWLRRRWTGLHGTTAVPSARPTTVAS
jgi:hypothetical protein